MRLPTPYCLVDERKLLRNLRRVGRLRRRSGAKCVLALKCFSTWAVFPLLRKHLDGTTSSALHEVRLGREEFGGETHAYCVGFAPAEMPAVHRHADKVIFNSLSQIARLGPAAAPREIGLRVNPGVSYSRFDLADPAGAFSRLGERDPAAVRDAVARGGIAGLMFHFNCENADFPALARSLDRIAAEFGPALKRVRWVSLGGGIAFTNDGCDKERNSPCCGGIAWPRSTATRSTPAIAAVAPTVKRARSRSTESPMRNITARRWRSCWSVRIPTSCWTSSCSTLMTTRARRLCG